MYLFHILHVIGSRWLFTQFKELTYSFGYALSSIQISFNWRFLAIELAYSHLVLFRLFLGFREINPVFLLISPSWK
jgi:hypothetical protein